MSVPDLSGALAYGTAEGEAKRKVKAIALQVLAGMIESGEEAPAVTLHRRLLPSAVTGLALKRDGFRL